MGVVMCSVQCRDVATLKEKSKYLSTTTITMHTPLPTQRYLQGQHQGLPHRAGHLETLAQKGFSAL